MQNTSPLDGALRSEQAPIRLVAVHDESGKYGADRYFVSGFVYVHEGHVPGLLRALREEREAEDYWGEIHYCRVGEVDGRWGAKFRPVQEAAEALVRGIERRARGIYFPRQARFPSVAPGFMQRQVDRWVARRLRTGAPED